MVCYDMISYDLIRYDHKWYTWYTWYTWYDMIWYDTIWYDIIQYDIVLYHYIILNHIISYCIRLYHLVLFYGIVYHVISYRIISCRIISYRIVSYHFILHRIVSYVSNIIIIHHLSYVIYQNQSELPEVMLAVMLAVQEPMMVVRGPRVVPKMENPTTKLAPIYPILQFLEAYQNIEPQNLIMYNFPR